MSGATLLHGTQRFATIPPWPENRTRSFQNITKRSNPRTRDTQRLLAAPAVSQDERVLYDALFVSDLGWWMQGVLALLRTLVTMRYDTLADAIADADAFKEVATARLTDTEKHIIKPFNLGLYLEGVSQNQVQSAVMLPLSLCIGQLQEVSQSHMLQDARHVLDVTVPYLESISKSKGAFARHADDVRRLRTALAALVAKLEKGKRSSEALLEAAK